MSDKLELILIFFSVIVGIVSAGYFYQSSNIFMKALAWPLKLIATGMIIIAVGVLLAAFISYASEQGVGVFFHGFPLEGVFYILYLIGSVLIAIGASKFTHRAKPIGSVV